jgi:hypothetical protein
MFAISVIVGPVCFPLMFKKEESAREAQKSLDYDPRFAEASLHWITIKDDFGHEFSCDRKQLGGYIFEDMDRTKLAHVERALHQQRTQNLAQKTAQSDPGLRMTGANGPGVLTPFSPMGH